VSIPKAQLQGVKMYGGSYDDLAPVVVQEVGSLNCPQGQVITRTMSLGDNLKLVATISMGKATMNTVLMKAANLSSSSGTLDNVAMTVENYPEGLCQTIDSGTMYNLETDIYFVSMGQLGYSNLGISIGVQ
jgi:hypothetical protein